MQPAGRPRQLSDGWSQITALAVTEMVSWGILYYAFTVIQTPIQRELHWSGPALTGAFSLALLIAGVSAVPVGHWLDRHGPRALMTLGSCLATLLVLALAHVQRLSTFYLLWAGIGVTMAMVLYEPAFAVVATWFVRQRSRALTLLTVGGGLASVVFVPVTELLVRTYGWRQALMLLAAVLAAITIPLHALVLRRAPASGGQLRDGGAAGAAGGPAAGMERAIPLDRALHHAAFWWLAAAFTLNLLASVALGVHLIPLLVERGESTGFAAFALALLGGSQLPGRVLFAPLGERLARRHATAALFGLQLIGLLVLLGWPSHGSILVFAALFGAGAGASSPARAALVADLYGARHYGRINGVLALLLTLARAAAPLGASALYASAGGYTPLLWLATALIGGAIGTVLLVRDAEQPGHGAGMAGHEC